MFPESWFDVELKARSRECGGCVAYKMNLKMPYKDVAVPLEIPKTCVMLNTVSGTTCQLLLGDIESSLL